MGAYPQLPPSEWARRYHSLARDARELAGEAKDEPAQISYRLLAEQMERLAAAAAEATTPRG
jgi:hypothetical protein